MQVSLGSDTLSPIRLRLGTFTHRSSVLVLAAAGSKLLDTISGKRIKRTSPTTNINLRPDSQTATQGTANTGPPYRLHSSHQADVYLPSDVRGSCGCSGAGSQPSRQARQVWLPLFPALTGLSRDQSGWLASLTGRITEGSRQAFSDGYPCSGRSSTLPARCRYSEDDANGESARISASCRGTVARGRCSLGDNLWCGTGADPPYILMLVFLALK